MQTHSPCLTCEHRSKTKTNRFLPLENPSTNLISSHTMYQKLKPHPCHRCELAETYDDEVTKSFVAAPSSWPETATQYIDSKLPDTVFMDELSLYAFE